FRQSRHCKNSFIRHSKLKLESKLFELRLEPWPRQKRCSANGNWVIIESYSVIAQIPDGGM
ncbi:20292_t:CDS:2, partial [Gigaspora rosea]